MPEIIEISEVSSYRGTPMVYIKITPWRNIGNVVEALVSGEIKIWVETYDYPVTFSHPYLLNGEKHFLQKTNTNKTQYLIICPGRFSNAAQSLAEMHSNEVNVMGIDQLITEVVLIDSISTNITGTELRNYIIQRIDEDNDLDEIIRWPKKPSDKKTVMIF